MARRWWKLRRRNVDRFIDSEQFDQPPAAVGLRHVNLHRRGGRFVDPEIDRIGQIRLDGADEGHQLRAAHFAFEVKRVAVLDSFLANHLGLLDARPHDLGNAGLGEEQHAVEARVRRRLAELLRQRIRLERALRNPDACQLQDRALLERHLDVPGHSVRRRIHTVGSGERDPVLLVQDGGRALALDPELGALERKNGFGRPIQSIPDRAPEPACPTPSTPMAETNTPSSTTATIRACPILNSGRGIVTHRHK